MLVTSYPVRLLFLDYVGTDVPASLGDYRLLNSGLIRLFVRPAPFCATFVQHLITFCSRKSRYSDVISGKLVRPVVLDKLVKYRDPSLNRSREIPPEAAIGVTFDSFSLAAFCPIIIGSVGPRRCRRRCS